MEQQQLLDIIKKLEAEQVPIKAQLAEIDKERSKVWGTLFSVEQKIREAKQSIKDLDAKADELVRIEKYKGVDPRSIKVKDLDYISLDMAHSLVKLIYKVDVYQFYLGGSEIPRAIHLTGLAYRDQVIDRIKYGLKYRELSSCRFCHCLFHQKDECPILMKRVCKACGKQGHDLAHCTVPIKDLIGSKRVTIKRVIGTQIDHDDVTVGDTMTSVTHGTQVAQAAQAPHVTD